MLYRSINVAIILLLSWFTYQSMRSSKQVDFQLRTIEHKLVNEIGLLTKSQQVTNKHIELIQEHITKQAQLSAEKKKLESTLSKQKFFNSFQATYATVLQADALRYNKQYKEAAKLIKGTKKNIWKAGDTYQDKQKTLRGLMPKIDSLVNAWNKGDGQSTAKSVYSTLHKIIQEKR